jgi:hypothetical protein
MPSSSSTASGSTLSQASSAAWIAVSARSLLPSAAQARAALTGSHTEVVPPLRVPKPHPSWSWPV